MALRTRGRAFESSKTASIRESYDPKQLVTKRNQEIIWFPDFFTALLQMGGINFTIFTRFQILWIWRNFETLTSTLHMQSYSEPFVTGISRIERAHSQLSIREIPVKNGFK